MKFSVTISSSIYPEFSETPQNLYFLMYLGSLIFWANVDFSLTDAVPIP